MWGSHCGLTGYTYIMACFGKRLSLHLSLQRHRDSRDQHRVMATSNCFQPHPLQTFLLAGEIPLRKLMHCICGSSCRPFIPCKTVCFSETETQHKVKSLICLSQHIPSVQSTGFVLFFVLVLQFKGALPPSRHILAPEVLTILSSNL